MLGKLNIDQQIEILTCDYLCLPSLKEDGKNILHLLAHSLAVLNGDHLVPHEKTFCVAVQERAYQKSPFP